MKTKLLKKLRAESKTFVLFKGIKWFSHIGLHYYITKITKKGIEELSFTVYVNDSFTVDYDYLMFKVIYPDLQKQRTDYILERIYELRFNKAKKLLLNFK